MALLPQHHPPGHEQEGSRPVIIVSTAEDMTRFPLVFVVPLTSKFGSWVDRNPAVYPRLQRGQGGIPRDSVVLMDQLRAIDRQRLLGYIGSLDDAGFRPIGECLKRFFGTSGR